jgi:hypothetical protein
MEAALRDRFGRLTADVDDIPEDDDCVAGHTAAPREITVRGRRARECMTPSPAWTLTDWPRYGPTANRHRTGRPSATPSPVPESGRMRPEVADRRADRGKLVLARSGARPSAVQEASAYLARDRL